MEDDGLIKYEIICHWWLFYNELYDTKLCTPERNA